MEHISVIVRCEYEKNAEKIIDHFDVKSAIYERANGSVCFLTIIAFGFIKLLSFVFARDL